MAGPTKSGDKPQKSSSKDDKRSGSSSKNSKSGPPPDPQKSKDENRRSKNEQELLDLAEELGKESGNLDDAHGQNTGNVDLSEENNEDSPPHLSFGRGNSRKTHAMGKIPKRKFDDFEEDFEDWDYMSPMRNHYASTGMFPPYPGCHMNMMPPPWVDYDWQGEDFEQDEYGPPPKLRKMATHAISDSESDQETNEAGSKPEMKESEDFELDADMLSEFITEYGDDEGPEIAEQLAKMVKNVWGKKKESDKLKEIGKLYPRPKNIPIRRVEINSELSSVIFDNARARDNKLKVVQENIAKATYPIIKTCEGLYENTKDADSVKLLKSSLHGLMLLGQANFKLNQTRREFLKPGMWKKYQSCCKVADDDDCTENLFGVKLGEKIKLNTQGSKIMKKPYNPYKQQGPSYGRYRYYGYGRPSRGAFLGKNMRIVEVEPIGIKNDNQMRNVDYESVTNNMSCSLDSRPRQEMGPRQMDEGQRPEQRQQELVTESQNEVLMVGEYESRSGINPHQWGPDFEAGRVSICVNRWANITTDKYILSDVRNYKLKFREPPHQNFPMPELKFSKEEMEFLILEIDSLNQKRVVVESEHQEGEFVSNIFLREKKEKGKFRMILNLSHLNKFTETQHFKMDTLLTTLALLTPDALMISVDFSDAYYSVSMFPPHRKYLKFTFQGKLYEFTCLPMGLSDAPRVFTKLMKVALSFLREKEGITISGYLDDQLQVTYDGYKEALRQTKIVTDLFQELGFTINVKKSVLTPTKQIEHLGFIISTEEMKVTMTTDKTQNIIMLIDACLSHKQHSIRQIARLIGKIQATKPANQLAFLYTKQLEIDKNGALLRTKFDFEAPMYLSKQSRQDLQWLRQNLPNMSAPIRVSKPDKIINTDASKKGWGYFEEQSGKRGGGRWSREEQEEHINVLEIKAILLTLQTLCHDLSRIHVRIMTDNTTAMICVNKQGSTKSKTCNTWTRKIWNFVNERDIWLSAGFCPGVENVEADQESREFDDQTEWTLDLEVFNIVCDLLGQPDIDLFATRINNRVNRYCAWQPDPGAVFVDALAYDWSNENLVYAFPPFSVIHLVLQKLIQEEAEGIIIVPYWPSKPWFTLFLRLLIDIPVIIDVGNKELFLPFDRSGTEKAQMRGHPLAGKLKLMAGRCNGRLCRNKDSNPRSSQFCSMHGDNQQINFTEHTLECGKLSVTKNTTIACHRVFHRH